MTDNSDVGDDADRGAMIDAVCRAMIELFGDRAAAVAVSQIEGGGEAKVFATWHEIAAGIAKIQDEN